MPTSKREHKDIVRFADGELVQICTMSTDEGVMEMTGENRRNHFCTCAACATRDPSKHQAILVTLEDAGLKRR
jgi:hypothetical protein